MMKKRMQILLALSAAVSMAASGAALSSASEENTASEQQDQGTDSAQAENTVPAGETPEEAVEKQDGSEESGIAGGTKSDSENNAEAEASPVNIEDFKLIGIQSELMDDGRVQITFSTAKDTFDKIYVGSRGDENKEPVIEGTANDQGGYTFTFVLADSSMLGQEIKVVPAVRETGQWYTDLDVLVYLPEADQRISYTEEESAAPAEETVQEPADTGAQTTVGEEQATIEKSSGSGSIWETDAVLGGEETSEETAEEAASAAEENEEETAAPETDSEEEPEPTETPVPTATVTPTPTSTPTPTPAPTSAPSQKIADGIYEVSVSYTPYMFNIINDQCTLVVKNGEMTVQISLHGSSYTHMYAGTAKEAAAASKSSWSAYYEKEVYSESDKSNGPWYTYDLPLSALDTKVTISCINKRDQKWFEHELIFKSEGMKKTGDIDPDATPTPKPTARPTASPTPKPAKKTAATPTPTAAASSGKSSNTGGGSSGTGGGGSTGTKTNTGSSSSNGTTSAVDNSTTLADGEYGSDQFDFSWSGGTGKVQISCSKITVKGGQAYATIAFSSSKYTYVKASGGIYYADNSNGNSVFEIPIQLNANNKIIAQTTAMSAPHEIEYTLYFGMDTGTSSSGSGSGSYSSNSASGKTASVSEAAEKLDTEAPKIVGLTFQDETKFEEAQYVRIFNYDKGFSLIEIDAYTDTERKISSGDSGDTDETGGSAGTSDNTGASSEETDSTSASAGETDAKEASGSTASGDMEEEGTSVTETDADKTAKLYQQKILKYLVAPEGEELPAGIEKDVIVIQQPADKLYVAEDTVLSFLDSLGVMDKISAVSCDESSSPVQTVTDALKSGSIVTAGTFDSVKYKELVKAKCALAVLPGDLLPAKETETTGEKLDTAGQQERYDSTTEKLALLKIPAIIDRSSDEKSDKAKAEWVKVYGVVFGKSDEAAKIYGEENEK